MMCRTCGCSENIVAHELDADHHAHGSPSEHSHSHDHAHEKDHKTGSVIRLEQAVLAKNDALAESNRAWLTSRGILALNIVSSPGSGKTTLLERTVHDLGKEFPLFVIEGDQAGDNDARRIRAAGGRAVQINTGAGCHLDADMVARGLQELDPPERSLVMIENVGNLVCPALFDLGEYAKVVVCSVTEGDDKPVKYPFMFRAASVLILNKIDLLPYVPFDVDLFKDHVRHMNSETMVIRLSALRGDGLEDWYDWLRETMTLAN